MTDLLLDDNKDLAITDGDFVVGESTLQHQDLLLMTVKGEWKESPGVGIGVVGFLKDEDFSGLMAEIKTQYEKDGMRVNNIELVDGKLSIDAHY